MQEYIESLKEKIVWNEKKLQKLENLRDELSSLPDVEEVKERAELLRKFFLVNIIKGDLGADLKPKRYPMNVTALLQLALHLEAKFTPACSCLIVADGKQVVGLI